MRANAVHVRRLGGVALPLLLCAAAWGQEAQRATEHPLSNVGLAIGARIPAFHAPDQHGVLRDFDSIRGPKGAVLYFHRSAGWCIYCQTQLLVIQASREDLRRNGLGLAAISYDSPEVLKQFSGEHGVDFPLLSDPESRIIRDFQVLDATELPGDPGYGVPYHGSYIVGADGIVTAKFFDAQATQPHSTGVVVSQLFGSPLNTHARSVRHKHLTLRYYASTNEVLPGDEIELFIDVTLNDAIHLYAPGAEAVKPADWRIAEHAGVTVGDAVFPKAETLRIDPINGTKEVYTGFFQLSRRVKFAETLPPPDAQGNIVLNGTFLFQACDETVCYAPTAIPLAWKLGQAPCH